MGYAPIALFVYKRPAHTRRTLESLLANPEARESPVYVFCDGARAPKDEPLVADTRAVVRSFDLPRVRIVEREANMGLARSIMAGVSAVAGEHGSVIVLEDDLVLSPTFLSFMNEALTRYREHDRVFGVSGYTYPADLADRPTDAVFLPVIASWGWATWNRAWRRFVPGEESYARLRADRSLRRRFDVGGYPFFAMLEGQQRGIVDSWAVRWYATVFLNDGLTLFPTRSLVTNIGLDGSGVHGRRSDSALGTGPAAAFRPVRYPDVEVDDEALRRVTRTLATERPTRVRAVVDRLARVVRDVIRR